MTLPKGRPRWTTSFSVQLPSGRLQMWTTRPADDDFLGGNDWRGEGQREGPEIFSQRISSAEPGAREEPRCSSPQGALQSPAANRHIKTQHLENFQSVGEPRDSSDFITLSLLRLHGHIFPI